MILKSICRETIVLLAVIFILTAVFWQIAAGKASRQVFTTWEGFEVDKCASIWLIKQYIAPNALIKIVPAGAAITKGIAFDVPDAQFRRYHNMSTFESLMSHYKLTDPGLKKLAAIVHDIEVNTWEEKKYPESYRVQEEINKIIKEATDSDDLIAKASAFFDILKRD